MCVAVGSSIWCWGRRSRTNVPGKTHFTRRHHLPATKWGDRWPSRRRAATAAGPAAASAGRGSRAGVGGSRPPAGRRGTERPSSRHPATGRRRPSRRVGCDRGDTSTTRRGSVIRHGSPSSRGGWSSHRISGANCRQRVAGKHVSGAPVSRIAAGLCVSGTSTGRTSGSASVGKTTTFTSNRYHGNRATNPVASVGRKNGRPNGVGVADPTHRASGWFRTSTRTFAITSSRVRGRRANRCN